METTPTFISASEAAMLCGVTPETIRNLCKAGTLRYERRNQFFYPCKEDIEQYFQSIKEVYEIERSIEDYKQEIDKLRGQVGKEKDVLQARLDEMKMFPQRIRYIQDLMLSTLHLYEEYMTEREIRILSLMLEGDKLEDIADKEHLSYDRTRQILEKAILRVKYVPDKAKSLEVLVAKQEQTIRELQDKLSTGENTLLSTAQIQILQQSIYGFDLSVRALNGLRAAEIATVKDLVRHQRSDLKDFRNFGEKSLEELDDFLAAHNLSWGMKID